MSPNQEPGDLRIRRTRLALRNALLSLIEEKGFEAITVQDLADRAMINRVTFYKHYHDKYELLEHTMHEMLGELSQPVETLLHAPADDGAVYAALVDWLEQVGRYASFYRTMLGKDGNAAFAAQLRNYLEAMVSQVIERSPKNAPPALPRAVRMRFVAAGFLGVTEWWLEQKGPLPVPEVATQLQWLLRRVTRNPLEE